MGTGALRFDDNLTHRRPTPIERPVSPPLQHSFELVSLGVAAVAIGVGVLVMSGWVFGVHSLKGILPGWATMKFNTAACFALSGVALWLSSPPLGGFLPARARRLIAGVCAAAVVLTGLLTLGEHVLGWDPGIDNLFVRDDRPLSEGGVPGRMSGITASNFLFVGMAVLLLDVVWGGRFRPSRILILAIGFSGYLSVVGYAYGVDSLYRVPGFGSVAVHTAVLFVLLAFGLLAVRPDAGLMSLWTNRGPGGVMFRRLWPAVLLLPPLAGGVRLAGEKAGFYGLGFGVALFATCNVVILALMVWRTAKGMEATDAARRLAEARFEAVVESAPMGMLLVDAGGRIALSNRQVEELFGYTRGELIGRPVELLVPDRFRHGHEGLRGEYQAAPSARMMAAAREVFGKRKDATEFPAEVGLNPVSTEEGGFVICSVVDLTERKRKDAELTRARDAVRSNEDLRQFASIASHDLQTPLRNISGFVQLLQEDYGGKLDDTANDYIDRTVGAVKRMHDLIDDILAYSQVDARTAPFEDVSLRAVFDDTVALLETAIDESAGGVTCDDLPTVRGDGTQLGQLFLNLISNGIKYRGEEPPRVHVSARREPAEWVISVNDNGIGIAPEFHERIFEIFRRLHHQDEYPGNGVGLALCRRVVERHGGRIWVESEAGHGCTFCFTFPETAPLGNT